MHSIRLAHPWQSVSDGDTVVWSRKFNWPAELVPNEIVQLVVQQVPASAKIRLNSTPLNSGAAGRFDITSAIAKHNHLAIASPAAEIASSGECPFDVRLEIVAV